VGFVGVWRGELGRSGGSGGGGELVRVNKPIKACFVCVGLA
jgi:hypothetical protein